MYTFKHQTWHQTFIVPQAKISVYIGYKLYSHRRNFSVLTAKLIVLPRLEAFKMVVKLLKWLKI